MSSEVNIPCRCKTKGCGPCDICPSSTPRCVCPHKPLSKRRGEHGQWKTTLAKKQKTSNSRSTNTYQEGELFESPLVPHNPVPQRGKYSSNIPVVPPKQLFTAIGSPSDLFRAFDMAESLPYWLGHAPSADSRENPDTWRGALDRSGRLVVKTVAQIVQQVCSVLCNGDEHAGSALWERVVTDHASILNGQIRPQDNTLAVTIAECYVAACRASTERRVLRACLSSLRRDSDHEALRAFVPAFSMSNRSFGRGRDDLDALQHGVGLDQRTRTLQRFEEGTIDFAVSAIFAPENVSFLSWGKKRIKLGGAVYEFPAIMRKRSRSAIYEAYLHQSKLRRPDAATVSQSSFYRVVSAITAGDATTKRAIDYVQGFLVNDAFDSLRYIIDEFRVKDRRELLPLIEYNAAYLKYGFDARVLDHTSPACILNNIEYGLDPTSTHEVATPVCDECKKVFSFYDRMKEMATSNEVDPSAHRVIDDCSEKARLYFAHRLRVVNQQKFIQDTLDGMRRRCVQNGDSDEALVLIDFKMKLEPHYFREKTVDHYGKRGMSWHGAMIQYFDIDKRHVDGCSPEAVDQRMYCDHISKNDNRQDREAVVSMIEAILLRIRKDLPRVKKIVIQSDNAGCYQNVLLPILFPYLASIHGIEITRFIHTETQDGKSILDAHFARSMQVLMAWVREGNNCITPTQAVVALKSHGGLPNTVVELVEHDRGALKSLVSEVKLVEDAIQKVVKRSNDVKIAMTAARPASGSYGSCPPFTLTFFEYSGIGPGVKVHIHPSTGAVTIQNSREIAQNADNEVDDEEDKQIGAIEDADDDDDDGISLDAGDDDDSDDDISSDGGEDIDVEELHDSAPDTIDQAFAVGPVTGVRVATQGQIRERTKRWRKVVPPSSAATISDPPGRDMVSYALHHAATMQRSGKLALQDPRTVHVPDGTSSRKKKDTSRVTHLCFPRGWGQRRKRGNMYGRRYASEFREDIEELFERGQANKSYKIGPGRMLEILRVRYPRRFDLPNENELRQEIAKLKNRRRPRCNKKPLDEIAQFFGALLDDDEETKPAHALEEFRTIFQDVELDDRLVKQRFSAMKSARRKARSLKPTQSSTRVTEPPLNTWSNEEESKEP